MFEEDNLARILFRSFYANDDWSLTDSSDKYLTLRLDATVLNASSEIPADSQSYHFVHFRRGNWSIDCQKLMTHPQMLLHFIIARP